MGNFHFSTFMLLVVLTCQDLVQGGICYKKYSKKVGRCRAKLAIPGSAADVDYETCCRTTGASGWKPSRKDRICIKCHNIVDGAWSQWAQWSACSVKCDWGQKSRKRFCNNPPAQHGGHPCKDAADQSAKCYSGKRCPIDGGWGLWTKWNACSKSCKPGGSQWRSRQCNNPEPQFGGKDCSLGSEEMQSCNKIRECPVDGNWGPWSQLSSCSVTCGAGRQTRTRQCNKPAPKFNGKFCAGSSNDSSQCFPPCTTEAPDTESGSGSGKDSESGFRSGSGSGSKLESGSGSELEVTTENGEDKDGSGTKKAKTKTSGSENVTGEGSGEGIDNEESGSGSGSRGGSGITEGSGGKVSSGSGSGNESGSGVRFEDPVEEVAVETAKGNSKKGKSNKKKPGWGEEFEVIDLK